MYIYSMMHGYIYIYIYIEAMVIFSYVIIENHCMLL